MASKNLKDILGPVGSLDYPKWLVRSSRSWVYNDINHKTAEWLRISTMTNKITGYVSVTRDDILDWVNEMDNAGAIILALCSRIKDLEAERHEDRN